MDISISLFSISAAVLTKIDLSSGHQRIDLDFICAIVSLRTIFVLGRFFVLILIKLMISNCEVFF